MGKSDGADPDTDSLEDENQTDTDDNLEDKDGDGDQETDSSFEFVLRSKDGSQPSSSPQAGIRRRFNTLIARNTATEQQLSTSEAGNSALKAQNDLLQMQVEQLKSGQKLDRTDLPPNPEDFDDGAADPKYVAALQDHNREFIRGVIQSEAGPKPIEPERKRALMAHYERVEELGYKGYDAAEEAVSKIFGAETFRRMIEDVPHTERIVPYLALNPEYAEELAHKLETNAINGVALLGALGADLIKKPRGRNSAPDPDTDLSGSTSASRKKTYAGPEGATYS